MAATAARPAGDLEHARTAAVELSEIARAGRGGNCLGLPAPPGVTESTGLPILTDAANWVIRPMPAALRVR